MATVPNVSEVGALFGVFATVAAATRPSLPWVFAKRHYSLKRLRKLGVLLFLVTRLVFWHTESPKRVDCLARGLTGLEKLDFGGS